MNERETARHLCEQGDFPGALQRWSEITSRNADPEDLLEYGLLLDQLYCLRDAAGVFDRLLCHPESTSGQWLAVAKRLCARSQYRKAVKFLQCACSQDPDNVEYAVLLGTCLDRSEHDKAAMDLLLPFLTTHPGQARLVRLIAHLERRQGKLNQSRKRMEGFLEQHDSADSWGVKYELANVLDRLGEYDRAMEILVQSKQEMFTQSQEFHSIWRAATRRQWQLSRMLDADRLKNWGEAAGQLSPDMRLCVLAGFPRSGTTLLERVLSTSGDCLGTDESGILAAQFRDPLILQADTADDAMAELESFNCEELSAGRAEYLRCTEEHIGEELNGRLLIEKEPLLTADLHVPLRMFPESKILMPLRDPRDVVISFFFTLVPLSSGSVASISLQKSCQYYAEVMRHWLHLREQIPSERWLELRYEDLLAEPEMKTRELADFLEIEWCPAMIAHHQCMRDKDVSTPTYDDVTKPLYKRSLARWKNYEDYLTPHLHYLQPYIEAFGYDG